MPGFFTLQPSGRLKREGLNLSLNIIFIPKYGLLVAAITIIISFAFNTLMLIYIINYEYKNVKYFMLNLEDINILSIEKVGNR